jgi:predicted amidohydrolase YtcJ
MGSSPRNWGTARTYQIVLVAVLIAVLGSGSYLVTRSATAGGSSDLPSEVLNYADLVLFNGDVLVVDQNFSVAQAVAVRDGKILSVGNTSDVMRFAGDDTRRIDLAGRTVVPGFIDSDGDNALVGGDLYKDTMVNGQVRFSEGIGSSSKIEGDSVAEMLDKVRALVGEAEPGSSVFVRMSDEFTDQLLSLTAKHLDQLAPNNPLFMSLSSSEALANTAMLQRAFEAGLPRDNFQVVKDKSGKPNGRLLSRAAGFIGWNLRDWPQITDEILNAQEKSNDEFLKVGVTTVTGHASGYTTTIVSELANQDRLRLRLRPDLDFARQNALGEQTIRRTPNLVDFGLADGMVRVAGAAVGPVDGASDDGGILTNQRKTTVDKDVGGGPFGRNKWTGGEEWTGKTWKDLTQKEKAETEWSTLQMLRDYGWNIGGNHNMGSAAAKIVMETLLEAEKQERMKVAKPRGRNALDHNLIWDQETIALAKQLGDSMAFGLNSEIWSQREAFDKQMLTAQYGDMMHTMQPVADLVKAGLNVHIEGGDTDEPPLWRVERFVTRTDKDGKVWGADQAIDRKQALRMVTYNAAKFISEEDMLGSIEAGKYADLVVLSGNYMGVPDDKLDELAPVLTVVNGEVVFEAK